MFPIRTDNRQGVQEALLAQGIQSHPWWGSFHPAVPWKEHPEAVKLKKTVLGLPVHQDLTEAHMGRILEALRVLSRQKLL
jgi:dTDP-4-amino-4,6-dideoxygalactose transaminase